MQRQSIYFSGSVQGVGFRYVTHQIATQHQVAGFVRNLADGRVELVMEGSTEEMRAVTNRIGEVMGDHIHDRVMNELPATNEFTGFTIRH